jgi:hypothetical protein
MGMLSSVCVSAQVLMASTASYLFALDVDVDVDRWII